jgi:hypothetical protein
MTPRGRCPESSVHKSGTLWNVNACAIFLVGGDEVMDTRDYRFPGPRPRFLGEESRLVIPAWPIWARDFEKSREPAATRGVARCSEKCGEGDQNGHPTSVSVNPVMTREMNIYIDISSRIVGMLNFNHPITFYNPLVLLGPLSQVLWVAFHPRFIRL